MPDTKPGLLTRLRQGAAYVFGGDTGWMSPLTPLDPVAPPEVKGRVWDYPNGININLRPRAAEAISFEQLRALADNCDLMRLVIETRKDQLTKVEWSIKARADRTAKAGADARIAEVEAFLEYPDREHNFEAWCRILVEDMLVLDAATIYPRPTKGGGIYALEILDGGTIDRKVDFWGRTPPPPVVAYQQVLKGMPAVDYAADELLYLPRNLRSNKLFGYSPVEQVVMTVNIAIRRQLHKLAYYTEGTVPDALVGVPLSWTQEMIGEFQQYWDGLLSDNLGERRKVRFVPGEIAKNFVQTKAEMLKDDFDEWLARVICYAFSVSAQWAIKQMNRATSETAQEQALQEGLAPLQSWLKSVLDRIIQRVLGHDDLEFRWEEEQEISPQEQAAVANIYARLGAKTLDEIRADLGLKPLPDGLGAKPMIFTAGGAVTIDEVLNPPPPPPMLGPGSPPDLAQTQQQKIAPANETGQGKTAPKTAADESVPERKALAKAARGSRAAPVDRTRSTLGDAETDLAKIWQAVLTSEGKRLAAKAATLAPGLQKADQGGDDEESPLDDAAFGAAGAASRPILTATATDGVSTGAASIGFSDDSLTSLANPRAQSWAEERSALMVSQISATTRDALASLIAQSEGEGWSVAQLASAIENAYAFSDQRAAAIAHFETRQADMQGNLIAWKTAKDNGIPVRKHWVTRGENICDECKGNESDGAIPVDETFSSGDDGSPAHPNCECDVEPVIDDEPDE